MPCAEKSTLYIEINTDNTGQLVGTPHYTWEQADTRLYGLKRGTGKLQYPVARVVDNPKYPCEKVPLNSHAPALPIIPDDGSYTPPHVTGQRHIMGASWIDGLSGAVIPVRGMNIHGGAKWLGTDASGICKSNAFETSVEMYGLVPTGSKYAACGFPYCVPCDLVGTGRGQFAKHCQRFYAPVNTC